MTNEVFPPTFWWSGPLIFLWSHPPYFTCQIPWFSLLYAYIECMILSSLRFCYPVTSQSRITEWLLQPHVWISWSLTFSVWSKFYCLRAKHLCCYGYNTLNDEYENFVTTNVEVAAECIPTKPRAKYKVTWKSIAVRKKWECMKKASLFYKRNYRNTNVQKLKKTQRELEYTKKNKLNTYKVKSGIQERVNNHN